MIFRFHLQCVGKFCNFYGNKSNTKGTILVEEGSINYTNHCSPNIWRHMDNANFCSKMIFVCFFLAYVRCNSTVSASHLNVAVHKEIRDYCMDI
jgi:hypothetical protein